MMEVRYIHPSGEQAAEPFLASVVAAAVPQELTGSALDVIREHRGYLYVALTPTRLIFLPPGDRRVTWPLVVLAEIPVETIDSIEPSTTALDNCLTIVMGGERLRLAVGRSHTPALRDLIERFGPGRQSA